MAGTAAIVSAAVSVGTAVYGGIKQHNQAKQADAQNAALLASRPNPAVEQVQADAAATRAGNVQKKKTAAAQGYQSTILTGPQGTGQTPPPAGKTLLGL